jgi:large subunit ribosomal protein L29
MKASELRKLNKEELNNKTVELEKELFNLRFQLHTGRLENTAKVNEVRKQISQVKTIISEIQA